MTTPGAALSGGRASPPEEARLDRPREPLPTRVDTLPELPPAYAHELDRVLDALGVTLDPGTRLAIDGHVRLLLAWNEAINLTAISDPAAVARLHVGDSLSALEVVRAGPHASLVDIGSGGGFPGLTLAAALPGARLLLVDSVAKKVAFLDAVRSAVGLADRVEVAVSRAEAIPGSRPGPGWDVATARAVGTAAELVELALPLLPIGGRLVAWKRGDLAHELAGAARAADALGGSPPTVHRVPSGAGLDGHALVVVEKVQPTPRGYPRDPAARRRRPW